MKNPKIWGEFIVGTKPVPELPRVDHVLGGRVEYDSEDKPAKVRIQYKSGDSYQALTLPFPDAMFGLSLLKSIQLDEGLSFPDDPRAPSAEA